MIPNRKEIKRIDEGIKGRHVRGFINHVRLMSGKKVNTPFGVITPNGLNFSKSVNNYRSNLAKLIRGIQFMKSIGRPTTKRYLLPYLGKSVCPYPTPADDYIVRGWGSTLFGAARVAGFITYDKKTREWGLGPKWRKVKI